MKRMLALLLAMCMLFALAACGQNANEPQADAETPAPATEQPAEPETPPEEPEPTEEPEPEGPAPLELPLANNDVTMSVWWAYPPWFTNYMAVEEKPLFTELSARTGVNLDVEGTSLFAASESFSLMLFSGDYPSIICDFAAFYSGNYDQAIEEGFIYDLAEYINTICPNYWGLINGDREIAQGVTTDGGNIPAFMTINDDNRYIRGGHWINTDMLAEVNMDDPVTFDDWHELLVAFRDQLGAAAPLWMDASARTTDLTAAFGVTADFYQENGEVKFGYMEDGMAEYLELISGWYSEGLVYKDFFTANLGADKPDASLIDTRESGIWRNSVNAWDYFDVPSKAISSPVLEEGQQLHFSEMPGKVTTGTDWVITTNCEKPDIAAMMIDYIYSDEGIMLTNFGVEGLSYEMVNGEPKFTDIVSNNPDISINNAISMYALFNSSGMYTINTRTDDSYAEPQIAARAIWADHNDTANIYPALASMSAAESEAYYNLYNTIDTYINENITAFIIGTKPLSEYDDFRQSLIDLGIEDCISIKQDALDRYNAR